MQTMARVPDQQHDKGLKTSAELLPQANFLEQLWQIGHDPAA